MFYTRVERERQIMRLAQLPGKGHADECVALSCGLLSERADWMETDLGNDDFVTIVSVLDDALERLGRRCEVLPLLSLAAESCTKIPNSMPSFVIDSYSDTLREAGQIQEADAVLVKHFRDLVREDIAIAPHLLGDIECLDQLSDEAMDVLWRAMDNLIEWYNLDRAEVRVTRLRQDYHRTAEALRKAVAAKRNGT